MDRLTKEAFGNSENISSEGMGKREQINSKILKFGCLPILILFVFVFIVGIFSSDKEKPQEKEIVVDGLISDDISIKNKSEEVNDVQYYRIYDNAKNFRKKFNSFISNEMNSDLSIDNIKISEGTVNNSATAQLNSNIGMVFQFNKTDNSIRSVMIIARGDGSSQSGLDILSTIASLIATVDSSLSPSERGDILKKIGLFGSIDVNNLDGRTIKNGIKYFINSNERIGIMFGTQSADEK